MPAQLLKPPHRDPYFCDYSIFLAGTIDMGNSRDWQTQTYEKLDELQATVAVFNPRRDDWDSSWVQEIENDQFRGQVEWELDHIAIADFVLIHFEPDSQSPITLLELGLLAGAHPGKMVVSCPKEFWRRGNVEIVCKRYGVAFFEEFDDALSHLTEKMAN